MISLKRIKRSGTLLLLAVLLLIMTTSVNPVSADEENQGQSVMVICIADEMAVPGMYWELYYIGTVESDGTYVPHDDFADYKIDLNQLTEDEMPDAAATLENYAILDGIEPVGSDNSGEDGTLVFPDNMDGVYLLCGEAMVIDNVFYQPSPSLFVVGGTGSGDSDNSTGNSGSDNSQGTSPEISIYAKILTYEFAEGMKYDYAVRKVWQDDDDNLHLRPVSITVQIYKDRQLDREVVLDASNHWTYSWTADEWAVWRVKEAVVPDQYTVIYRSNITQFLILNTYTESEDEPMVTPSAEPSEEPPEVPSQNPSETPAGQGQDSSETPSVSETPAAAPAEGQDSGTKIEKLPQTGQLWWPIPVCGCAGIILMAIGLCLRSGREKG